MKFFFILISLFFLICACVPDSRLLPESSTLSKTDGMNPLASTPVYTFTIKTWVNYPELTKGRRVILMGSLIKNGVYLGGIMMRATWSDKLHKQGEPNCIVPVNYGKGVCPIDTSSFPPGVYVPVTVTFEYQDAVYVGQTGFTP